MIPKNSDYRTIKERGEATGTTCINMRESYDPKIGECMEVWTSTPYRIDNRPIVAYTIISLEDKRRDSNGLRPYGETEFWTRQHDVGEPDRNIEDILASRGQTPTGYYSPFSNTWVPHYEALQEVGLIASACSEYNHVLQLDEFKEKHARRCASRGSYSEATTQDYLKYLDEVDAYMLANARNPQNAFVGLVKNTREVDALWEKTHNQMYERSGFLSDDELMTMAFLGGFDY